MAKHKHPPEFYDFIKETNRIEGLGVGSEDVKAHERLFELHEITIPDMENFVHTIQPGALLRDRTGMNVRVGRHTPPPGGITVMTDLKIILDRCTADVESPYSLHCKYETLHPFMDGNGRSGRALWAWQMITYYDYQLQLGFLHKFYYQTLDNLRQH